MPEDRSRSRVNLNGEWERHIGGKLYDLVTVPSSRHPTGLYSLRRNFLLPRIASGERAYVHFEGITYFGRVAVNGVELGTMGPYVPYEFEFSSQAQEGRNQIEVGITDLAPGPDGAGKDELALGVNPGWEAYGGIIRDVWVELRPSAFIENVRLGYELSGDYSRVECRARVYVSSREGGSGEVEVVLQQGAVEVARGEKTAALHAGANEVEVVFRLNDPALWSPESPQLYELRAGLKRRGGEDGWGSRTGFREVKTAGREFRLNGQRLVLKGVCRHDMWKGQGFTLTRAQQEQDMRMIKGLGCNFVRLVHYPHDRHIVELADEVGLLVSEEPGYWGMDFQTMARSEIELGYRILEKTIQRDWNSPAVFAWLLSNECRLTVEVLKEGKERCNKLDPIHRLVSAANSMSDEKAKPIFEQSGMDFFDQHPYTFDVDNFNREAAFDGPGKPLTFTEWGGKAIGQSQ
ncbi:MAG: glycoside hydrolase family 2 protein, partial [Candidatus Dormibacteraceae bacterium]